jgi:F-type H+-transporting ATPase subunit a
MINFIILGPLEARSLLERTFLEFSRAGNLDSRGPGLQQEAILESPMEHIGGSAHLPQIIILSTILLIIFTIRYLVKVIFGPLIQRPRVAACSNPNSNSNSNNSDSSSSSSSSNTFNMKMDMDMNRISAVSETSTQGFLRDPNSISAGIVVDRASSSSLKEAPVSDYQRSSSESYLKIGPLERRFPFRETFESFPTGTSLRGPGLLLSATLIPTTWQIFLTESFIATIFSFVKDHIKLYVYIPLIGFIFFSIFISNILGMIPYCSSITTELSLILFIAWSLGIGIFIQGFYNHRSKLVHIILPMGTPIFLIPLMIPLELLAYLIRFLSLALRLTINIMTGHILIVVCVSFLYQAYLNKSTLLFMGIASFLIAFIVLEILIAYLQAYIFTFIFVLTLKEVLG